MFNNNNSIDVRGENSLRTFLKNITKFLNGLYEWALGVPFFGDILKKIDKKFIKFLFVGGINTIFGYSCYAVLLFTFSHIPNDSNLVNWYMGIFGFLNFSRETLALTLQWIIGVLWNFQTTGRIVFKSSDSILIWKFFGVYIISYFVGKYFLELLLKIGFNGYVGQAIIVLPVAIFSFILMKTFVFNDKK